MTITPERGERANHRHLVCRAGLHTRSVPQQVTTALRSYLDAVTEALARWNVPATGTDLATSERTLSGRIQLDGHRDHSASPPIRAELRWFETTGWELALHDPGDPEPMPWRFLHAALVPDPSHVASFTHGLLRGEDLGMAHPVRFRRRGEDVPTLTDLLRRHGRDGHNEE